MDWIRERKSTREGGRGGPFEGIWKEATEREREDGGEGEGDLWANGIEAVRLNENDTYTIVYWTK